MLRELLQEPTPRAAARQPGTGTIFEEDSDQSPPSPVAWTNENVVGFNQDAFHTPRVRRVTVQPPTPIKSVNRTDDIIETAMKLMDLCMDQNRYIRRLEREFDE